MALVISACGSSTPSAADAGSLSPSAAALAVKSAVAGESSVQMVATEVQSGKTITQSVLVTRSARSESLSIGSGKGAGSASILILPHDAYLKATTSILTSIFGMPAADASHYAGHWLYFTPSSSGYKSLSSDVSSMSGISKQLDLSSVKKASHPPIDGVKVVALAGKSTGTSGTLYLYVPASGPALPVAGLVKEKGPDIHLTFSSWGKPASITAPPGAVAFTQPATAPATSGSTGSGSAGSGSAGSGSTGSTAPPSSTSASS